MGFGSTVAVEQEQELFLQKMQEVNALRAAMLMHFKEMGEADAISLALKEIAVLEASHPGTKMYDDEGYIIANLDFPEANLPDFSLQPADVQARIEARAKDLLARGVVPRQAELS